MSNNPYSSPQVGLPAAAADAAERSSFIMRTYHHLFGAIFCLVGLEVLAYKTGVMETVGSILLKSSFGWIAALGAFMVVGWLFSKVAHSAESKAAQYGALGGYVVLEALILMPLLWMATTFHNPSVLSSALWATLLGFGGLTAVAFITRADFSFMRSFLMWGGMIALALIGCSLIFGFNLGIIFSIAMVGFAGACILYDTSNVMHHYPTDRHVGASIALFASVALLFWYVLSIVMELAGD